MTSLLTRLSAAAILVHLLTLPLFAQVNLLSNGSFESGTLSGWSVSGGATSSTIDHHSGSWSMRVTTGDCEAIVTTTPGSLYKVTAWINIAHDTLTDWGGFRVEAISYDWTSLAHSGWLTQSVQGAGWTKIALPFTATTTQTRLHVGYYGGPSRQMIVYADDIALFPKPAANQPPQVTATLTPTTIASLPSSQTFHIDGDDPDGAIVLVDWNFGDGQKSQALAGSRIVDLAGSYTATVRVTDDDGAVVLLSVPWTSGGGEAPVLAISSPDDSTVTSSATVSFTGSVDPSVDSVRISTDRDFIEAAPRNGLTWSAPVSLQPGRNRVMVQAKSSGGLYSVVERIVQYIPSGPLGISSITETGSAIERWDVQEITFHLDNSGATHPQFSSTIAATPGLSWVDGVTVDALFTPDNWVTVYRRPAFLLQKFSRALKGNEEWLYPDGGALWCVRFAPPIIGTWRYVIQVSEKKGGVTSTERSFAVVAPTSGLNHGPVRVSKYDTRYFEFADGTYFTGTGHGIGFSAEQFSYDAASTFASIGDANQNFFRWWIAGTVWGSAWQPWNSRDLSYDGTVPATGLTTESAYGDGFASLKLNSTNRIMFQGFNSGHAGLTTGQRYMIRVRWRTEGITGPAVNGSPYGICVKLTGWPEPGQTSSIPVVVSHEAGSSPWHVSWGTFVASTDLIPNLSIIFENATGGAAFVDECDVYSLQPDGSPGTQLLRSPKFNSCVTFDQHRSAGIDAILQQAMTHGKYFKIVISEKQEYLLNHIGDHGIPDPRGGHFSDPVGSVPHALHEAYWRYLFARFGAYRSVQSWESVNEDAPGPGNHFRLAADLAQASGADGNPHPADLSTWATLATEAWKDQVGVKIPFTDFHAYVRGTGWIEQRDSLANDAAAFFAAYDSAAGAAQFGRPVVWGEMGIDGTSGTDGEDPGIASDLQGVWLHKIVWARCAPGGVYPLYWYTNNIFGKNLHGQFGAWNRFMSGVALNAGGYTDIGATVTGSGLRVMGQHHSVSGHAFVWIDNKNHTWRAVVDGKNILPASGTVTIPGGQPSTTTLVRWFSTQSGTETGRQSYQTDASGLLHLSITSLARDTALQIGTGPLVAVNPDHSVPRTITLEQNYPNPFNPTTEIRFTIPNRQSAKLSVYDLIGREVAVLVDGVQDAGTHVVLVDGSAWATGVYFYRLRIGGTVLVRKMLLVK